MSQASFRNPAGEGRKFQGNGRTAGLFRTFAWILSPQSVFTTGHGPHDAALKAARRGLGGAAAVGTALAAGFLSLLVPVAVGVLIDRAIPGENRSLVAQLGLGLVAVACGKALLELIAVFAAARATADSRAAAQAAFWDHVLKLSPSVLRGYSSGDLSMRALALSTMFNYLDGAGLQVVFAAFAALLNLALMFYFSAGLALTGLAAALGLASATLIAASGMRPCLRLIQEKEGRMSGWIAQLVGGISKLRVYGSEQFAFDVWKGEYQAQQDLNAAVQRMRDWVGSLNQALPPLVTASIFWIAGVALVDPTGQRLSLGYFLAFSAAFGVFIGATAHLSNAAVEGLTVVALWERARPLLLAIPENTPDRKDPGIIKGGIRTLRVSFRYRDSGPLVLEDVVFQAEPGEFVGIVGPSGSGKSTLLRLLLGFEMPSSGTVYYDGRDLSELDVISVRRQLGIVLQNSNLISGSIFENIAAGADVTLDQAWEAARRSGIAGDIKSFPMGIHTFISESAGNISMGQRQRILIARALVFAPRVLLFDEATGALDDRTQAAVGRGIEALKVTRIVIAHRLSTIRKADRIYVMEKGRVAQVGTFDELASQDGLFARMVARQMPRGSGEDSGPAPTHPSG